VLLRRVFLTAVLGVLLFFALAGASRFDGPVLLGLTSNHGVHLVDLPLVLLALAGLVVLWLPGGRRAI
jgi:hypothetical protein